MSPDADTRRGEGESPDTTWLEDHGWLWAGDGGAMFLPLGGGWELVCGIDGNSRSDTFCCAVSLSLHHTYPGPPKVAATFALQDDPTVADVRRAMAVFGK